MCLIYALSVIERNRPLVVSLEHIMVACGHIYQNHTEGGSWVINIKSLYVVVGNLTPGEHDS